jgi:stage III sporulation protein SpoIIIAA
MLTNTIKKLLEKEVDNGLVKLLQSELTMQSNFQYTKTNAVPIKQIRDIYSFRAKVCKERNKKVLGFEKLLKTLEETRRDNVVVHAIGFPNKVFLLFIDTTESELFGILLSEAGSLEFNQ